MIPQLGGSSDGLLGDEQLAKMHHGTLSSRAIGSLQPGAAIVSCVSYLPSRHDMTVTSYAQKRRADQE